MRRTRLASLAALALLLSACLSGGSTNRSGAPGDPQPQAAPVPQVESEPLTAPPDEGDDMDQSGAAPSGAAVASGDLVLVPLGVVDVAMPAGLGGISGAAVDRSGVVRVVSDRGSWARLSLALDPTSGRLLRAAIGEVGPILDEDGLPLTGSGIDAEDLAMVSDGRLAVVFEGRHRIAIHGTPADPPSEIVRLPVQLERLESNRAIESLAALPDARLVVIAEGDSSPEKPGWIYDGSGWQGFTYVSADGHRPSGAAALPDGRIVVIERKDPSLFGIGGRIVVFDGRVITEGARLRGTAIGLLDGTLLAQNYEAVAVLRTPDGGLRLLFLSDDNLSPLLTTRAALYQLNVAPGA